LDTLPGMAAAFRTLGAVLLTALLATTVGGCAPRRDTSGATPDASARACAKASLRTLKPGTITIGTDDPVYPPWFSDNKPDNGKGFESAVAYAVADELGYGRGEVTWVRVTFDNAIAPGPKPYDFDINEFSITEERRKAVDFSSPYYDVRQAVVALKTSKIAGAKSVKDLSAGLLGAQVGTTSYKTITDVVKPAVGAQVYNSNDDAKEALKAGQIDGIVVDLPTAYYIAGPEIAGALIVGTLPQPPGQPEQFGLVLDKGSPLTACVSRAVDALRSEGRLAQTQQRWLSQETGTAELT
jgi:polar amino acid transport system substrate-binding protein